jgi:PAS domain S-box-containing protein
MGNKFSAQNDEEKQASFERDALLAELNSLRRRNEELMEYNTRLEAKIENDLQQKDRELEKEIKERNKFERALQQSKRLSESILDSIPEQIFLVDVNNCTILNANHSFLQSVGLKREEVYGSHCYRLVHGQEKFGNPPDGDCPVILALKSGEESVVEHVCEDEDGSLVYKEVSAYPVCGPGGQIEQMVHMEKDITVFRQRERKLELLTLLHRDLLQCESLQQKMQLITEGLVKIFNVDFARIWLVRTGDRCNKGCVHANVKHGRHACLNPDKCLHLVASAGLYTHIDGGVHARIPFGCYKVGKLARGDSQQLLIKDIFSEPNIVDKDWAARLGLTSFAGFRLVSGDGKPQGVMAMFSKRGISPEDKAMIQGLIDSVSHILQAAEFQGSLQKAERKYRHIFENAPVGIIQSTPSGKFLEANPELARILGYVSAQELKEKVQDIAKQIYAYPDERQRMKSLLEKQGEVKDFENLCLRKDGRSIWTSVHLRKVPDDKGRSLYYEGFVTDIDKRKRAEKLRQDVERIVRHDMKSPLNGIIGFAQLLQMEEGLSSEQREYLSFIYESGTKMLDMISHSMDLIRIEEGTYQLRSFEFNFINILSEMDREVEGQKQSKSLSLRYLINKQDVNWQGTYLLRGEKLKIKTMLSNLLVNALEASPVREAVELDLYTVRNGHKIDIYNQGLVPEEIQDRFFEAYVTSGKDKGTGLGTYSSRLIARAHGGDIQLASTRQEGTVVSIFIPEDPEFNH